MAESGGLEPHWFHPAHCFQDRFAASAIHSPEDAIANMNIYYRKCSMHYKLNDPMAGSAGFEPADEISPVGSLAVNWFKPLTQLPKIKGKSPNTIFMIVSYCP